MPPAARRGNKTARGRIHTRQKTIQGGGRSRVGAARRAPLGGGERQRNGTRVRASTAAAARPGSGHGGEAWRDGCERRHPLPIPRLPPPPRAPGGARGGGGSGSWAEWGGVPPRRVAAPVERHVHRGASRAGGRRRLSSRRGARRRRGDRVTRLCCLPPPSLLPPPHPPQRPTLTTCTGYAEHSPPHARQPRPAAVARLLPHAKPSGPTRRLHRHSPSRNKRPPTRRGRAPPPTQRARRPPPVPVRPCHGRKRQARGGGGLWIGQQGGGARATTSGGGGRGGSVGRDRCHTRGSRASRDTYSSRGGGRRHRLGGGYRRARRRRQYRIVGNIPLTSIAADALAGTRVRRPRRPLPSPPSHPLPC